MLAKRALVLLACVAWASLWASPALALCAGPPPLGQAVADASEVFVGTVTAISNEDRWVTVTVSDVWKGDVPAEVEVHGGPADPPGPMQVASSNDRTFREGETYLFVPEAGEGAVFSDSSCSSTTRYREAYERFRPASAHAPEAPPAVPEPPGSRSAWAWWAVAAAAAGAAGTLFLRRRAAV